MNPEYKEAIDGMKERNKAIIEFIQDAEKKLYSYKSPDEQKECFLAIFYLLEFYKVFSNFMDEMASEKGEQRIRESAKRFDEIGRELKKSFEEK